MARVMEGKERENAELVMKINERERGIKKN